MVAPIFCVNSEGQVQALGTLIPVRPEGFVMVKADGPALHSDGLPWWLFDMRPQGYLGRAYASAHAAGLGLPPNPEHWRDADVIRALLAHGTPCRRLLCLQRLMLGSGTKPCCGLKGFMRCLAIAGAFLVVSCRVLGRSAGISTRRGHGLAGWGNWEKGLEGIGRDAGDFIF